MVNHLPLSATIPHTAEQESQLELWYVVNWPLTKNIMKIYLRNDQECSLSGRDCHHHHKYHKHPMKGDSGGGSLWMLLSVRNSSILAKKYYFFVLNDSFHLFFPLYIMSKGSYGRTNYDTLPLTAQCSCLDFFRCDSISWQVPLSVSGLVSQSVMHSFKFGDSYRSSELCKLVK